MKKHRIISFILAIIMLLPATTTAYAASYTYSPFVKANYNQPSRMTSYKVSHGLDLSVHNGTVDFAKIKKAGVNFVILRAGYRGYGSSGTLRTDDQFETYYKNAKKQGLRIGVYFYSQAISESEAIEEANRTLSIIGNKKLDLPVYFDYEFADVYDGRLDSAYRNGKLSKAKMTAIVKAYCKTIEKKGLCAGVYSSTDFLTNKYNYKDVHNDYSVWNAHYTSYNSSTKRYGCTSYGGNMQIWQYSAAGKVNGISTYVDCNFLYEEPMYDIMNKAKIEVSKISSYTYSGKEIKPNPTVTFEGVKLIKGEDYYVSYKNNKDIGTASITIVGVNKYASYKSIVKTFYIVPTKVKNLVQTERTTSSITFKWSKHNDANKYRIQQEVNGKFKTVANITGTNYTLKGVSPCQSLKIRVSAVKTVNNKDYVGRYSDVVEMSAEPEKVSGVKRTSLSPDSIRLQWNAQEYASQFEIYEYKPSQKKLVLVKRSTKNYCTIKDLKVNSKHTYRVRAIKKLDDRTKLVGKMSKAYTTYVSPAAPEITSATSQSANHITVRWKKTASAGSYQIMWSTSKDFKTNKRAMFINNKTAQKILETAQSGKTYYVRIRSCKMHGGKRFYSKWSNRVAVKVK